MNGTHFGMNDGFFASLGRVFSTMLESKADFTCRAKEVYTSQELLHAQAERVLQHIKEA